MPLANLLFGSCIVICTSAVLIAFGVWMARYDTDFWPMRIFSVGCGTLIGLVGVGLLGIGAGHLAGRSNWIDVAQWLIGWSLDTAMAMTLVMFAIVVLVSINPFQHDTS
jgi:hypothetical protein